MPDVIGFFWYLSQGIAVSDAFRFVPRSLKKYVSVFDAYLTMRWEHLFDSVLIGLSECSSNAR